MKDRYVKITPSENDTYTHFMAKMHEIGFLRKYAITEIIFPVHIFLEEFVEYIAENGLSSLIVSDFSMEDITSPTMHINKIEQIFIKFVMGLAPAKKLIVIDPFFYEANSKKDTHKLFMRLLNPLIVNLEEIIIISNNPLGPMQQRMHAEVKKNSKTISITDIKSNKFHDRFWINPSTETGIVIGTSLTGLGKKISLIDKLATSDVVEILSHVRAEGVNL